MAKDKKFAGSPSASDVRPPWSSQIIPKESVVSGNTTIMPGMVVNQYAKTLYDMSSQERKVIAEMLKSLGYRVSTSGGYSSALATAYATVMQQAQFDAQQLGQAFSDTFFKNFVAREIAARGASGAAEGPRIVEQSSVITESDAKTLINAIIRDQNNRAASAKEIEKYTSLLQRKAAKNPTITRTETVGGKTVVKTQPGFGIQEAQSLLLDKISGTDEAKANKVLSYYETFMNALGGR